MRRFIQYLVIFATLGVVILYGITFKAWNPSQVEDKKELQGASVGLINEWIICFNSTMLYQYGVNINVTNTGQSSLELSNLQINFTGEGRDKTRPSLKRVRQLDAYSVALKNLVRLQPQVTRRLKDCYAFAVVLECIGEVLNTASSVRIG
jgi:hypothetical protein